MAHLSKADWNKLKKLMGNYKGTVIRGVRWNPSADKKRWAKEYANKAGPYARPKAASTDDLGD